MVECVQCSNEAPRVYTLNYEKAIDNLGDMDCGVVLCGRCVYLVEGWRVLEEVKVRPLNMCDGVGRNGCVHIAEVGRWKIKGKTKAALPDKNRKLMRIAAQPTDCPGWLRWSKIEGGQREPRINRGLAVRRPRVVAISELAAFRQRKKVGETNFRGVSEVPDEWIVESILGCHCLNLVGVHVCQVVEMRDITQSQQKEQHEAIQGPAGDHKKVFMEEQIETNNQD
ncbi:hypothetical protein GOBAR_AA15752 [Gossypium barbadense]|uniref:Uncharacterized protein n=1 Tax=Gossypium barbadense TaxID=3634 RepID=A0A2P5XNM6_GOSBA|nr:hypothetical protein GOBAR_AA15752 [Gossypium barbadense]